MKLSICLLIAVLPALTGCASLSEPFGARGLELGSKPTLSKNEVVIFGRILFIENGKRKAPYDWGKPIWQLTSPAPTSGADGQSVPHRNFPFLTTRKDAAFAYLIPAGRYEMTVLAPFYYTPLIDPALEFDASEPGKAYYLGDLEVDIDVSTWLGGLWGNYITHLNYLEVVDRLDQLEPQISELSAAGIPIRKALLTRIYGRVPELKSSPAGMLVAPPRNLQFGR